MALVGFGTIGEARARAYAELEGVELVAIADPTPSRRQRAASLLPAVALYAEVEGLLRASRPDAVDICSPPAYHEHQIRLALEHGCHVLCEKPLVTRAGALDGLIQLALSVGRVLYPAHNYRFSPAMGFLERALQSGWLGEPLRGCSRIVRTGHAHGVPDWCPDWRRDPLIAGGGILTDHGTHCVYMASRLCGAWPRAVSCLIERNGPCEETARLQLDFGSVRWSVDLTWAGTSRRNYYALVGSAGAVVVDDDRGHLLRDGGSRTEPLPSASRDPTHSAWFPPLFAEFRASLSDAVCAQDALAEALATALTVEGAYASAAAGGGSLTIELPAICRRTVPSTAARA